MCYRLIIFGLTSFDTESFRMIIFPQEITSVNVNIQQASCDILIFTKTYIVSNKQIIQTASGIEE